MSTSLVFEDRDAHEGLTIENTFEISEYCRACLRVDCPLTPTTSEDSDSVKICDKLHACVSEVVSVFIISY